MSSALLPDLFKTEYSKIVAVLCKQFGWVHIETAEDIATETFLLAAETWGLKGLPDHPTAWLYTVAKNKTKDHFRRHRLFAEKIAPQLQNSSTITEAVEVDLSEQNIQDSQLRMLFAVCHPAIPAEAQIGLALRILCGFGIGEIAEAFLTNKDTINKRLLRAKDKLRNENISLEFPAPEAVPGRLEAVTGTIYLLFNEGYYSTSQQQPLRKELCVEAMRLCLFLTNHPATNLPIVNALMALMCFHASRLEARTGAMDEMILYENQDPGLWDDGLIHKGNFYLTASAQGAVLTKFHLEASIAYWHCSKTRDSKKWEHILSLYNQLVQLEYSPITALNRTYALAQVHGKVAAIAEAEKLGLTNNHFYYSLLGYLYTELDTAKAKAFYQKSFDLARAPHEKQTIAFRMKELVQLGG